MLENKMSFCIIEIHYNFYLFDIIIVQIIKTLCFPLWAYHPYQCKELQNTNLWRERKTESKMEIQFLWKVSHIKHKEQFATQGHSDSGYNKTQPESVVKLKYCCFPGVLVI